MDIYSGFAWVYDSLMKDVDYGAWIRLAGEKAAGRGKRILELGCGTGTMAIGLSSMGYDVVATDVSEDMLTVAMEKASEAGRRIQFRVQDMRAINIRDRFDAVISFCDAMNYMVTESDMESVFKGVHERLSKGGRFIFEMSTVHKLQSVIGDSTIAENTEDVSFIWENSYDSERHLLSFDLALFIRTGCGEDEDEDLFERHMEHHIQRGWSLDEIGNLSRGLFKIIETVDTETMGPLRDDSSRMAIIMEKLEG